MDKDNFISYGFDSYIKTFQDFFHHNNALYQEHLDKLKDSLDSVSISHVEAFLERILRLPLPSKDFLIRKEVFYLPQELREITIEQNYKKNILPKYYEKYNLLGNEKLEIAIFRQHCGLKKLSPIIQKSLLGTVFIDAGAFWGDSALILTKYQPKKIISFEPNTINFLKLQGVIKKNSLENLVKIHKVALARENHNDILYYLSNVQNHGASLIFKPFKAKEESVSLVSLDSFYKENYPNTQEKIGLIKLDVEGYALQALLGACNIIKLHKPIISCAIYHNPEEFFYILPLLQQLNPEYNFSIMPLNQSFILKEMTLLAWI